jgi:diaminopimelate epimerase
MTAFAKYEGLGNDFIVVDARSSDFVSSARAAELCDRRFGIGADGVLLVLPARDPANAARMKVVNADGSVPEMCGNGLRCVALHVARARGVVHGELAFETDAGVRRCAIDDASTATDAPAMVTVDMGVVRVIGERTVDLDGALVSVIAADAGNPHAILFGEFSRARIEDLGPKLATHAAFPSGTNVEFARIVDGAIDLFVWERGVGITLACGTGACATLAVACDNGHLARDVETTVKLPGGALSIMIESGSGRAIMRGPARRVFVGDV